MSLEKKFPQILSRFTELNALLSEPDLTSENLQKYSKELSDLTPLADLITHYQSLMSQKSEAQELLNDADMKDMAKEELLEIEPQIVGAKKEIELMLLPKDEADSKNAILEIRAGTGGEEAALFATNLYEMYKRYASSQNWRFELSDISETDIGGYKEARAIISGDNVFARLKFESGVHRVQRIPDTETGGRIHTSAATVVILPEAEEVDIVIEDKDLRIDVFRASGAGGQHVNTTDSAVRITHIPTGTVVSQQDEKSQHKNKAKALKILRSRIYQKQRDDLDATRAADRKSQVGSGDRSERIRTYNYPQGRVTDHRIGLTLHKLDKVLAGEGLSEIIDPLIADYQAKLLLEMSD